MNEELQGGGRSQTVLSLVNDTSFIHLVTPRRKQPSSISRKPRRPHPTSHNILENRGLPHLSRMLAPCFTSHQFHDSIFQILGSEYTLTGYDLSCHVPVDIILSSSLTLLGSETHLKTKWNITQKAISFASITGPSHKTRI